MNKFSLYILIAVSLSACAPHHGENVGIMTSASTGVATQQSLQAFQSSMYSFGQAQGCVKCHGTTVNPKWMSSDLVTAYSFARPMLDLNDPGGSIFATYVANGHCGDPGICGNAANIPIVQDALSQWAAVELSQGGSQSGGSTLPNPSYVTTSLAVPSPLPLITSGKIAVLRFDLTQLTPQIPELVGAILEISIQSYNSGNNTYRIFNPRLAGNSKDVILSGVHVYVRAASGSGLGVEDINQGDFWSDLNVMVPKTALPSPLPTGAMTAVAPFTSQTLGVAAQSAADVITLGFANIQVSP